jgi:hypothetical protein
MHDSRLLPLGLALTLVLVVAGCASIPADALKLSPESLRDRQLQTRVFDTEEEAKILAACSALLQDLGFSIDESETRLGVLTGSKDRSALNAGQVAASVIIAVLTGVVTPVDKNQKMRVSIVCRPVGEEKKRTAVRVTFQRIVWNTYGQVTTQERIGDPAIYQEFFDKLSKALFLEAHEI